MHPWQLFIASSGKGHRYAKAIKSVIDQQFKAQVCFLWNLGAFETGSSFLDSLERLPSKYNCGLAVFTADDRLGDLLMAPRDNVVLEFGLFLGAFGRERSFLLIEDRNDLKIPSDYTGIAQSRFYTVGEKGSMEEHRNAVLDACTDVVERLNSQPLHHRAEPLERIESNWRQRHAGKEFQLFSLYGLCDQQEDSAVDSNEEHVYYLWADPGVGSWIRARIVGDDVSDPEYGTVFQVEFQNQLGGFPGNVAIRLRKRSVPSALPNRFQRLRFYARIPSNSEALAPVAGENVYIGIRVVDALTTHWEYCRVPHQYILMQVAGERWQEFKIPLQDAAHWSVFPADGNYRYHDHEPDFSQILAVVFEMGSKGKGRPGPGAGVVQLKGFRLE
jgi:hypothetical protein